MSGSRMLRMRRSRRHHRCRCSQRHWRHWKQRHWHGLRSRCFPLSILLWHWRWRRMMPCRRRRRRSRPSREELRHHLRRLARFWRPPCMRPGCCRWVCGVVSGCGEGNPSISFPLQGRGHLRAYAREMAGIGLLVQYQDLTSLAVPWTAAK